MVRVGLSVFACFLLAFTIAGCSTSVPDSRSRPDAAQADCQITIRNESQQGASASDRIVVFSASNDSSAIAWKIIEVPAPGDQVSVGVGPDLGIRVVDEFGNYSQTLDANQSSDWQVVSGNDGLIMKPVGGTGDGQQLQITNDSDSAVSVELLKDGVLFWSQQLTPVAQTQFDSTELTVAVVGDQIQAGEELNEAVISQVPSVQLSDGDGEVVLRGDGSGGLRVEVSDDN